MSVLSISGCAHVISIHAFHLELSCLCLSDISTTSSGMPVHNTEASDASSFRSFLTGYGPRTYLTCRSENEMLNSTLREINHIAKFNGTNFSLWKFGTWLLLEQHNLVGIVNGDEPYPVDVSICSNIFSNRCLRFSHSISYRMKETC